MIPLFAVISVNVPVAGVVAPMVTSSRVPPLISAVVAVTAVRVPRLVTFGCAAVCKVPVIPPVAVKLVNLPSLALAAPITVPSILPPLRSTVAAVNVPLRSILVTSKLAAVKVPVTVAEEMVNPLAVAVRLEVILKLVAVTFVNSAVDWVLAPMTTLSRVPALISAVVAVTAVRVPRLVTLG